ncbi:uncharacterized protein BP5553_03221 [Venustampulla echinocandica]|uniref:Uncharacterized protein n=1 Tax=Venustampulla echinocandica TaxID=2656787 RepID=A0A370TTM9_9HELO|nr:uncharacterized protein BP5553_03221 [Venustampulla echinocandica]RDL38881.1 hypothetical protein BP5553_03221 [Venustampulla echinocandica]
MENTTSNIDEIPGGEADKTPTPPVTVQPQLLSHYALNGSTNLEITIDFRRNQPHSVISAMLNPSSCLLDCSLFDVLVPYKNVSRNVVVNMIFRSATEEPPILKLEQRLFIERLAGTLKTFSNLGVFMVGFDVVRDNNDLGKYYTCFDSKKFPVIDYYVRFMNDDEPEWTQLAVPVKPASVEAEVVEQK